MTIAEIERQFATNFYGVVYVMRAVLPVMRKQRSGHIINISSVAGVVGFKHCAAYGARRSSRSRACRCRWRHEVEQFGIKITLVEPGFFRTDLLDARNVRWPSNAIEDYAAEGSVGRGRLTTARSRATREKLGEAWSRSPAWRTRRSCSSPGASPPGIIPAVEERLRRDTCLKSCRGQRTGQFSSTVSRA